MTIEAPGFDHESVTVRRGPRSGLPITVAVHSTVRGPAVGGCRIWSYAKWRDGTDDALRLAEAMTLKCAVANLPAGGGKAVIALAPGQVLDAVRRRDALLDLGEIVEGFGGAYRTGEDVGTSAQDMQVVREKTAHVFGLPTQIGGTGEPAEPTAAGVHASLLTTFERLLGSRDVAGRTLTVIGLGQVGSRLAARLAGEGGTVTVTDIDPAKSALAVEIGARWVDPGDAPALAADVLVPAAVGGLLTAEVISALNCRAVVGPANNQLADASGANLLAGRGILWAPDFVVSAGGVTFAVLAAAGRAHGEAMDAVTAVGSTLGLVYDRADAGGITPLDAARELAAERLGLRATSAA
jgi:leucine dehydrogenase